MNFSEWFYRMYVDDEFRAAEVADRELMEWEIRELWPRGSEFKSKDSTE